jgi:hypothetical protein
MSARILHVSVAMRVHNAEGLQLAAEVPEPAMESHTTSSQVEVALNR